MPLSIDFGTSNTVAAVWDAEMRDARSLPLADLTVARTDPHGREFHVVPSLMHFHERGQWTGQQVVARDLLAMPGTFRWMKTYTGSGMKLPRTLFGKSIDNFDAAAAFLTQVINAAGIHADLSEEEVAFTLPVESFEHAQSWLDGVVRSAGVLRPRYLDEASAAALGYAARVRPGAPYLVFDFGGGTLDVSIVRSDETTDGTVRSRLLGKAGAQVGGSALDQWLAKSTAKAVICTGARASAPPIAGLDTISYLTNETVFSLTELPKRIGIIGAGPIGCEMAQTFARLGSEVYLVESAPGILIKEDPDATAIVKSALIRDGVTILCCGKELKLAPGSDGCTRLTVESMGRKYDVTVDQVLVAVGRAPNVEGLDLERVGVEYSKKGVTINDNFRTTNKRIYAAGDICSPYQFTHAADFMARAVIRNTLFFGRAKHSSLVIPWATYTSPEVAQLGLNPAEAEKRGIEIDTFTQPMSGVDRAILEGDTDGFVRVHVKKGGDEIVGATIVATHAGDMIGSFSIAMTQGIGLGSIANSIHPYPTQGEALRKEGDLYNKTRLTPRVAALMKRIIAWQR